MVECNRRLAERNKTLMDSCKNFEETISFLRDEKLTLVGLSGYTLIFSTYRKINMIDS